MKIHIKNMVCQQCVMVVNGIVQKAGINETKVQLGEIEVNRPIPEKDIKVLGNCVTICPCD